jgi:ParB-like chromosome segregation protein Spo0J
MVEDYFEIVCGVGRYTLARERGMRRVPVVVREMTADEPFGTRPRITSSRLAPR